MVLLTVLIFIFSVVVIFSVEFSFTVFFVLCWYSIFDYLVLSGIAVCPDLHKGPGYVLGHETIHKIQCESF